MSIMDQLTIPPSFKRNGPYLHLPKTDKHREFPVDAVYGVILNGGKATEILEAFPVLTQDEAEVLHSFYTTNASLIDSWENELKAQFKAGVDKLGRPGKINAKDAH